MLQILQAFFPVYFDIMYDQKFSEFSHSSQKSSWNGNKGTEERGEAGRAGPMGKGEPTVWRDGSCGNAGISTRAPGICPCLDIRTGPPAPASFLQLPWTMLPPHQTAPWPPNLEEQVWCQGARVGGGCL